ncbi:hypothetical protein LOZ66_001818 [Ophidiomyces ophidiicola]|nr:hypothetical protein LOZ66_001818 [Ophidiomyces ophidiicola]
MRNRCTFSLRKPKVRQSWNKYNLYNLYRAKLPQTANRTFFQQKWTAKAMARGYHGEQIREGQWELMFARRLRSVVPMDARYLARNDGSRESDGRGSGLERSPSRGGVEGVLRRKLQPIPYMQMTFAPMERRLDVAIFRAMFASSTRQARQFVIHGFVTVNGKKMKHAGYLLNPGDLFQVQTERVMYATGAPKDALERRSGRIRRRAAKGGEEVDKKKDPELKEEDTKEEEEGEEDHREVLKRLLSQAKGIMNVNKDTLPAKRRQDIRAFQRAVRRVLSRSSTSTILTENLEAQFLELKAILSKDAESAPSPPPPSQQTEDTPSKQPQSPSPQSKFSQASDASMDHLNQAFREATLDPSKPLDAATISKLSDNDLDVLKQALVQLRDNPIDSTKPYATPWRPRDYMSPFAFIPRYLEVNHNICAAVYIRHPVARPGLAEVPTPFGEQIGGPAYVWYLKRR